MGNGQIAEWLMMLGPNDVRRYDVVVDLLRHARQDRMTPRDRLLCHRALMLLRTRNGGPRRQWEKVPFGGRFDTSPVRMR